MTETNEGRPAAAHERTYSTQPDAIRHVVAQARSLADELRGTTSIAHVMRVRRRNSNELDRIAGAALPYERTSASGDVIVLAGLSLGIPERVARGRDLRDGEAAA